MNHDVLVTTGDLKQDYLIIGPVYYQISNKGFFSSKLGKMKKHYTGEISAMRNRGQMGSQEDDMSVIWGLVVGEWSLGHTDFEAAFYISVQELKKQSRLLKADAIIGMRQDIDLDTNNFQFFYLQMYGTAVKFH